jgi:hypothetical protein
MDGFGVYRDLSRFLPPSLCHNRVALLTCDPGVSDPICEIPRARQVARNDVGDAREKHFWDAEERLFWQGLSRFRS